MKKFKILSIDGGGFRGAASARFLELVENELDKPLHKSFDLVAGSSTGAIIAAAIASGKSMAEISNLYNYEMGRKIFPKAKLPRFLSRTYELLLGKPKYDGQGKTEALRSQLGSITMGDILDINLIITTYNITKQEARIFKNKDARYDALSLTKIVDASSAGPVYFPPVKIEDEWYIDGGISANNPAMNALAEALKLTKNNNENTEIELLSVGTGLKSEKHFTTEPKRLGPVGWIKNGIIDMVMDSGMEVADYQCRQILDPKNYLRVNSPLKGKISPEAMDIVTKGMAADLKALGEEWFKTYGKEAVDIAKRTTESKPANVA